MSISTLISLRIHQLRMSSFILPAWSSPNWLQLFCLTFRSHTKQPFRDEENIQLFWLLLKLRASSAAWHPSQSYTFQVSWSLSTRWACCNRRTLPPSLAPPISTLICATQQTQLTANFCEWLNAGFFGIVNCSNRVAILSIFVAFSRHWSLRLIVVTLSWWTSSWSGKLWERSFCSWNSPTALLCTLNFFLSLEIVFICWFNERF